LFTLWQLREALNELIALLEKDRRVKDRFVLKRFDV
jgi:hypothetical protein